MWMRHWPSQRCKGHRGASSGSVEQMASQAATVMANADHAYGDVSLFRRLPFSRYPLRLGDLSGRYQPRMFTSDAPIVRAIHLTETPICVSI
jgi:hypothetical protein